MTPLLEATLARLRCPDDLGGLSKEAGERLVCTTCERTFRIVAGNAIDLLPAAPATLKVGEAIDAYIRYYTEQFAIPFEVKERPGGWGGPEAGDTKWQERRARHRAQVFSLLPSLGPDAVICDFSGGAGFYSLELARRLGYVLHCDLSVEGVSGARYRAEQYGITNVLFVRMDYLRPPFEASLDVALCLDTLVFGRVHERLLLTAVRKSLAPGGCAIVDFHHWWHNPIRALGVGKSFGRSYSRREAQSFLRASGSEASSFSRFHQEFDSTRGLPSFASRLVPATRLIYRFDSR